MRHDDDQHREQRGSTHFHGCFEHSSPTRGWVVHVTVAQLAESAEDVFDHDHRAVHDDAEVHRTQRQQIGWNAYKGQPKERGQQRQRNDRRHNERCPNVGEEQHQHGTHEHRAFEQIAEHGGERLADQPRAVVVRHDGHTLGQLGAVDPLDLVLDAGQNLGRVLAFAHDHDAIDDIVVMSTLQGLAYQTLSRCTAHPDVRHVLHEDRDALVHSDHHVGDVGRGAQFADRADQVLL